MQGDTLILTYQTIVNFASERSLRLQTDKLAYESSQILKKKVSNIKKLFSESSDDPLSLKEEGATDDVELIQATSISPLKVGYYRRKVRFRIEN